MIENTAEWEERVPGQAPRRTPGSMWWTIVRNGDGPLEMLTIDCDGEEVLPVFGYKEEAMLFLGLGIAGDGWRARESGAGELISMLYGPYAGIERVVLDPLPETLAGRTVGFVGLGRVRFVNLLLKTRRSLYSLVSRVGDRKETRIESNEHRSQ